MSGVQPEALPHSRPAQLRQRNGGEIVDTTDPPREPMAPGEKVGLAFLVVASVLIALGGLGWLINNFFPHFWSIL